ncbi:MAG TPA: sigma factor [Pyrinomonadaceae bacterium]|jgi:DNA-directed RNA polymerase specialized sigma24 family protein|nr:sigma factor [Pyrinomonadaceae bacterium]
MSNIEEKALTDLALRAAGGDEAAFDALWGNELWVSKVRAICKYICRQYPLPGGNLPEDSEELIQNTCERLIKKRALFSAKNGATVFTWCFHVARNIHYKEFRKRKSGEEHLKRHPCRLKGDLSDEIPGVALRIKEQWDRFNPRQRRLYVLSWDCDNVGELAEKFHEDGWLSLSGEERDKAIAKLGRELKALQKTLVEAAEEKGLAALGRKKRDADGPEE